MEKAFPLLIYNFSFYKTEISGIFKEKFLQNNLNQSCVAGNNH